MKHRGLYQISPYINAKSKSYRVIGVTLAGVRVRENYSAHVEALARKQQLEVEAHNFIPEKRITTTRLTSAQEAEAEIAYTELGRHSMLFAVRFFKENYREPVKKIAVREAFAEFITAKEAAGLRSASVKALRCRVGFLVKLCPDKLVSDILPTHVSAAISQPGVTESSRQDNRRSLSSFFSWCMDREYCQTNPAKKTSRTRGTRDDAEPEILGLADVRKLLDNASTFKDGKLVPYVALSLFAGIRPTELARLTWNQIDLEAGTVTIDAKLAKMRQRRIVEFVQLSERDRDDGKPKLPADLHDWLLLHAAHQTPLRGANYKRLIQFGELTQDEKDARPIDLASDLRKWLLPRTAQEQILRGANWQRIIELVQVAGQDRHEIKLPKNLCDWLLPHAEEKTPLRGQNWRRDFDALKLTLGFGNPEKPLRRRETGEEKARRKQLKPWTQDLLRHTAISNHLAYLQHEGKTAAWAGNSPDIIQRHYKGLVKPADAKAFWTLTPESLDQQAKSNVKRATT